MLIAVTYPNGRSEDLIKIPEWDPDWQSRLLLPKADHAPRGSTVRVVAHYDNSGHARNPNRPPRRVTWGFGAYDEMCEGFIAVVKKGQDLTQPQSTDDLAEIFIRQRVRNKLRQMAKPPR